MVLDRPLPTYPEGFPAEVIERLRRATGRDLICNRPDNGLAAIAEFGAEHLRTGALILYTSQDSVLQLAAHVERVPPEELYRACETVRSRDAGRACGGACDRAAVRGPGGLLPAHARQARLRARAYGAQLPGGAARRGRGGGRRRQDRRPVRPRGCEPLARRRDERAGDRRACGHSSRSSTRGSCSST